MIGSFAMRMVVLAIVLGSVPQDAAAGPNYLRWSHRTVDNVCEVTGTGHSKPCCTVDGWDWSGDNIAHPVCPTMIEVSKVAISCLTDQPIPFPPRIECPTVCGCGDSSFEALCPGFFLAVAENDSIDPGSYQCDGNSSVSTPEQCDGQRWGGSPVDQGCGKDEHGCSIGDSDPAPVRYSSGRVESLPIALFSLDTPLCQGSCRMRLAA